MPRLRSPRTIRPIRPPRRRTLPRVVVVGDLVVDVVLAPDRALVSGSDVPGRVFLVQGGSAATTARWLARLGARSSLVAAIGRDAAGRALVDALRADRVTPRVIRVSGSRTGRIGVLVAPGGERSFVQDRGAAVALRAEDLRPAWFADIDLVHVPAYSLLGEPLGSAGRRGAELGRAAGALVSTDLSSIGPLLVDGRDAGRARITAIAPDVLFATAAETAALLGGRRPDGLLDLAGVAVVKRGAKGVTVLARPEDPSAPPLRFDVATRPLAAPDTTGAGDAFTAGFLIGWWTARRAGRPRATSLRQGALAGHRAAARHLAAARPELAFG